MTTMLIAATDIRRGMTLRAALHRGGLLVGRDEFPADRDAVVQRVDVMSPFEDNPPTVVVVFRGEGVATCVGDGAVHRVTA